MSDSASQFDTGDVRLFQFQAALVELSRHESASLEESLRRIAGVGASSLDVSRVSVWLFNEDQTQLRCALLYDRDRNVHESGAVLEMNHYPRYFQAMQESRTISADDAAAHPSTAEFAVGYLDVLGITSMLDVPLRKEGRTIGVLCNEHCGPPRTWRISEQTFAGSLADLTALVLETDRRRQAERELRKSLDQLELFFSQSLDAFFFMTLDEPLRWHAGVDKEKAITQAYEHQRLTKVNDAMLRQYGASAEQLLGQTPASFFRDDPARGRKLWRPMFDAGRLHLESEQLRVDGSRFWVEGDYICLYDNEGRITGHFGVQRDITERKQAEQALRRYNQRLRLLRQTDAAILAVRSVEEIAQAALGGLRELVPLKRASVAVFEHGAATLVGVLAEGRTDLGPGDEAPMGLFGDLEELRQGRPRVVDDIALAPPDARSVLEGERMLSFVLVPLLVNGELIGTLDLYSDQLAAFSSEHLEIAHEVAERLAVAIMDARLNQQVREHTRDLERRVAERTIELSRAIGELRESRERIRSLYDNTPVMMHSGDAQGRLLDVNDYWLKVTGYERHEVIGRPTTDFATPESARRIREELLPRLARDGFIQDEEVQGVKKNGGILDLRVTSLLRRAEDGSFLRSQAFLLDITETKRAERARAESEERLAGILRSAMDAIIVVDAQRRIVICNEAAGKVFRCEASRGPGELLDGFLSEQLLELLSSYIASAGTESPQLWVPEGMFAVRSNGERFPIEATFSRTEISTGTLFTLILRDINERKEAEARLEQLQSTNVYLQEELQSELNFEEIVGASPAIQKVFEAIEMVAQTDSTVLLLGETGTGKELIARALHNRSRRKQGVMVKVNCGALPGSLVESELFGHEKGAFTGAVGQKKGRFEVAHRGTIFLDETGELPLETQTKLLRILQEQEFERVGGAQTIKVDVRVIAATNRDLEAEVRRGAFRADLYYRLNVFPIEVPPLRDRKDDIPLLASYFVRRFSQQMGKRIQRISRSVYDQFYQYDWPGNVRELANLLERAVIHCQGDTLQPKHITLTRAARASAASAPEPLLTLEEAERRLIRRALAQTGGVLAGPAGAAELLGINRSTLWSRMRKLGIEIPKTRGAGG